MPELPRAERPQTHTRVITLTADRVLKQSEHSALVVLNSATSLNVTLPAQTKSGLRFTFFVKTPAGSGVGHTIKVMGSTAKLYSKVSPTGAAIAEAAGKGVTNTQATAVKGDMIHVEGDGTDWLATRIAGTFAREA